MKRMIRFSSFSSILLLPVILALGMPNSAIGKELGSLNCSELKNLNIANTTIISADVVAARDGLPEYCKVRGYVRPSINFEVRLPTSNWNKKFHLAGCGGFCGSLERPTTRPGPINAINYALKRNYAVAAHDSGHWGSSVTDGTWAYYDRQKEIDYGYRAVHEVARVSKELIKAYYGSPPTYSYFVGCSNGGRQAGMEAQRFPEDFHGIISGAPSLNMTGLVTLLAWFYQANRDFKGEYILDQPKLRLIADAVYSECDGLDGLEDGIISDPRKCSFKPESLLCHGPETENCLTAAQVVVLEKFYDGVKNSSGKPIYPGGMPFGSEAFWGLWAISKGVFGGKVSPNDQFAENGLNYLMFQTDPKSCCPTPAMAFDFDSDPPKLAFMGKIIDAINPDLSNFKEKGGKLIMWHGWADAIVTPFYTAEYYESVVKKMGGLGQTQDFFRLFMVPGADHCSILPGKGPDKLDALTALENWVEKGIAPDQIIASQVDKKGNVLRTRPLCPYPKVAKYKGSGSLDDAANFTCVGE